jgi:uncharacterized protein
MKNASNGGKFLTARLMVGTGAVILVLGALVLAVLASIYGVNFIVDMWWFDALGYGFYFWQRILYRYAVFAGVTLVFFLIFFLNFWLAARFLRARPVHDDALNQSRRRRLYKKFQTGSIWFYGPLSLALSVIIALPLYRHWKQFLFYVFGQNAGLGDPYLHKDISFYILFSLPIYHLVLVRLLLTLLILAIGLFVLYMVKNHLLEKPLLRFGHGARWHLNLLLLSLFGVGVWEFMLQRYDLVYGTNHQAIFLGPGYVEMNVILPLIWACMITLAFLAVSVTVVIQGGRWYKTSIGLAVLFIVVLGVRYSAYLPQMVQTYVVQPNELAKESPYISKHIRTTLNAYKLTHVQIRKFRHERFPEKKSPRQVAKVLRNIPLWDENILGLVYRQLQELRPYYAFPQVSVGRYHIRGEKQQVFLSARELEFKNLPGGARNWINEHMTYTHGFGTVMTPASQVNQGGGMTWYLHSIPPQTNYGLPTKHARIYYGMGRYTYSIAPNRAGEMDYPSGENNVYTNYNGTGGVPVSSLFRKLLFSYYMKNKNIFFTTKTTGSSKVLFRRNIVDRIHHLAPFLLLDQTPYVAVTKKGVYWIVDAYTTSAYYPASAYSTLHGHRFNYIRNSVKIVVSAANGTVDFYVWDPKDPIIKVYERIYPSLFKSKDQLPKELEEHIRYPKDLFDVQMKIYAKYHQTDPQVFYQQEDLWTSAQALKTNTGLLQRPYYVTLDLIKPGHLDFLLMLPMFPKNRDNLRSIAIAGCDPANYGKIIIYNFPKGQLVFGPDQVNALINQNPDIAQQFTLWDQAGSKVVRGKMILLPVGHTVLFIQPVYLRATARVSIPELQRVIMSQGEAVAMDKTIQEAYADLKRKLAEQMKNSESSGDDKILGQSAAPAKAGPTAGKRSAPPPAAALLHNGSAQPAPGSG